MSAPCQGEQPWTTLPRTGLGPLPMSLPCPEPCPLLPASPTPVFMRQSGQGGMEGKAAPTVPSSTIAGGGRLTLVPGCQGPDPHQRLETQACPSERARQALWSGVPWLCSCCTALVSHVLFVGIGTKVLCGLATVPNKWINLCRVELF